MRFIKLKTRENDARYINLEHVSRVTLATDVTRGIPLMVIFFSDARPDTKLEIDGSSEENRAAIKTMMAALDSACKG